MELHAMNGQLFVTQAHDLRFVIACRGGDLQAGGQGGTLHEQRVVASGLKGLRHAFEHGGAAVVDHGGLAMHQAICPHDIAAEDMTDGLMTKADAEQGDAFAKTFDDRATDASFLRGAGAGRDADVVWFELFDFFQRHLVIAANLHDCPHLAEILHEVVGE